MIICLITKITIKKKILYIVLSLPGHFHMSWYGSCFYFFLFIFSFIWLLISFLFFIYFFPPMNRRVIDNVTTIGPGYYLSSSSSFFLHVSSLILSLSFSLSLFLPLSISLSPFFFLFFFFSFFYSLKDLSLSSVLSCWSAMWIISWYRFILLCVYVTSRTSIFCCYRLPGTRLKLFRKCLPYIVNMMCLIFLYGM